MKGGLSEFKSHSSVTMIRRHDKVASHADRVWIIGHKGSDAKEIFIVSGTFIGQIDSEGSNKLTLVICG